MRNASVKEIKLWEINGVRKTRKLHAEEWNWTPLLYHSQKLTQNALRLEHKNPNCETPRRKLRGRAPRHRPGNDFYGVRPKAQATKAKISVTTLSTSS